MGMVDQHVSSCEGMKDESGNGFLRIFTPRWVSCGADAMKERQKGEDGCFVLLFHCVVIMRTCS